MSALAAEEEPNSALLKAAHQFNQRYGTKAHNRKDFDCGNPSLNEYLQRSARQNQDQDMGRTYVLVEAWIDANTASEAMSALLLLLA